MVSMATKIKDYARKSTDYSTFEDQLEWVTSASSSVSASERKTVKMHPDAFVPEASILDWAIFSSMRTVTSKEKVQKEEVHAIIFPWSKGYKAWWGFTVFASVITNFFETYEIAFDRAGLYPHNDFSCIFEYILTGIFVADIVVNFNLAYYNERDEVVHERKAIARKYLDGMFWVDLAGIFPFYVIALACSGQLGQDSSLAQYLALLRLIRLVRLYRVKHLFEVLQYSTRISLIALTLTRNFAAALVWTHFAACVMYFIARQYSFNEDDTWIGGSLEGLNDFERYVTSLYWSVVTFTTVGYGDFSPANSAEQIWGIIYMFISIVIQSWIIGSITLLIVKNDEKTGLYRDTLETLDQYATMHSFDEPFHKRLKMQLKLDFNNREIADEQVLKHFPTSVRRKVLRKLYLPSLSKTSLMQGVRQQFVDAFLTTCSVEIFSPGEEILQRDSISSDLFLLVGGVVELAPLHNRTTMDSNEGTASDSSTTDGGERMAGDFINEIGFFTESPQIDTVRTVTVCKTLTMSRSAYKLIAQDHPGSAGKILQNLLSKVELVAKEFGTPPSVNLPKSIEMIRCGSVFFPQNGSSRPADSTYIAEAEAALTAIQDLVKMHISKQKDDHTTRFLFAASRNDNNIITLMCDQGFDPNSADYDHRTALMVAAMKGNTEVVSKLLEYEANPNLVDMHGSSALYEAARNGHETTMGILLDYGAELCMSESLAASTLCQAVFDGDILLLKRLLQAKIQVDASDYDKRAAVHIAAAEGNVAALKVMAEFGADLTLKDRWGNTVEDEAKAAKAAHFIQYLETLKCNQ